jgi:uncharacterized protein (DUF58 family)
MGMEAQNQGVPSFFMVSLTQFFVGVLLFIALLNGQQDLIVLSLIVLCLAIGTRLWAGASLSGICYHSTVNREKLFPGETFRFEVKAENKRFLPVWLQVEVPLAGFMSPSSAEPHLSKESSLLWKQSVRLRWDLLARQRGVHHVGPSLLRAGDLFGFFSREKRTEEILEIVVYPQLVPLRSFPLPRRDFFGMPGAKSPVQDPIYILGTRDYQQGQPAKHIHWKASARYQRLQEKVFEPTTQEKILLAVDVALFAKGGFKEEFERTLEIVASLAARLERKGYAVGLITNGPLAGKGSPFVPIARGSMQFSSVLEVLARLRMEPPEEAMDALLRATAIPRGASCVYFAYGEDGTTPGAEEYLRHQGTPVLFLLWRPQPAEGEKWRKGSGQGLQGGRYLP